MTEPGYVYKNEYISLLVKGDVFLNEIYDLMDEMESGKDEFKGEDDDAYKAYSKAWDELEELSTNISISLDEIKKNIQKEE